MTQQQMDDVALTSGAVASSVPPLAVAPPVLPLADRLLAETVYRAMCMIAAAVKVRTGVAIVVKMGALTQT